MASVPKRSHAHDQAADVRTRSAGIATRPSARSAGRSSVWLATSNGAGIGKSWSRCRMRESGCG